MAQRAKNVHTAAAPVVSNDTDTPVPVIVKGGTRSSFLDQHASDISAKAAAKVSLLSGAAQLLAEANDLYQAGDDKAQEAQTVAGKAAVSLYKARASGLANATEVSEVLGNQFGFKVNKSTGKPGKTPDGKGEEIRKRVVRLVDAKEYVLGGEPTAFFDGLDKDVIAEMVEAVETGGSSIYTIYDEMREYRKEQQDDTRVDAPFNPKTVMAWATKMAEGGSAPLAQAIIGNPALAAAWAAVRETLTIADELAAELAEGTDGEDD